MEIVHWWDSPCLSASDTEEIELYGQRLVTCSACIVWAAAQDPMAFAQMLHHYSVSQEYAEQCIEWIKAAPFESEKVRDRAIGATMLGFQSGAGLIKR